MRYLLIFIFLTISQYSQAQLPDYYVYLVSGHATIAKSGTKPIAIRQNQLVYKNNVIVLKEGAEITLVDKEANFLVLNTMGSYNESKLIERATIKNNIGITNKYLKLLFHELLDPNDDFEKFKKENVAGVWGGVSRADGCGNRIFPVNGLKSSAGSVVFRWHKTSPSSDYLLVIYNGDGKELAKLFVKDTLQLVNINETLHGQSGKYFWRVTSKDGICEDEIPIYFDIITPENEKKLTEQLVAGTGNESLEIQLKQIDKLERNAFINVASEHYFALVNSNPDNEALRKSYVLFLLKYGFEKDAASAWK